MKIVVLRKENDHHKATMLLDLVVFTIDLKSGLHFQMCFFFEIYW